MFKNKKMLKEIETKLKELEQKQKELKKAKEEILSEQQKLNMIREILNDNSPKIDISNVYIFEFNYIFYIVKINVEIITDSENKYYISTIENIFNQEIIYQKKSSDIIKSIEIIKNNNLFDKNGYASIYPICEFEPKLLAYTDKQVPIHTLKEIFYDLNTINISSTQKKLVK